MVLAYLLLIKESSFGGPLANSQRGRKHCVVIKAIGLRAHNHAGNCRLFFTANFEM